MTGAASDAVGRYAPKQQVALVRELRPEAVSLAVKEIIPGPAHERADDWAVCAFGPRENAGALTAAALSGHSRVGFENNLHLSDGTLAPDSAALGDQVRAGAALLGRPVADAAVARDMLLNAAPRERLSKAGQRQEMPQARILAGGVGRGAAASNPR
ncbi:MAG: 3-keto-5-aminohexanoate cleavage protein [Kiloniellales bacterium]